MKQEKGFTLIELLVVIAIIALLLSILMPSLGKVKQIAESIACAANLRSYGIGMEMLLNDNDNNFPDSTYILWNDKTPAALKDNYHFWHNEELDIGTHPEYSGKLFSYIPDKKILYCKTFVHFAKNTISEHEAYTVSQGEGPCGSIKMNPIFSYGVNNLLGPGINSVHKRTQVRLSATTFIFSEENSWVTTGINQHALNDSAIFVRFDYSAPNNAPMPFLDSFASLHGTSISKKDEGYANAVFLDGHVERVEPKDSFRLAKPR